MLEQHPAGLAELHAAARTDHQRGVHGLLQGLHLLADRGLGAAQLTSGGGEGAGAGDGTQDAQMAGLDHASKI